MICCVDIIAERSGQGLPEGTGAAQFIAEALGAIGSSADSVYVATLDGGAAESIHFWAAAHETGFAFANPGTFPWTLANSSTGHIAKALSIRGPTYTLVGKVDALTAAFEHALEDLGTGRVSHPLVVAHDRVDDGPVELAAALLATEGGSVVVARTETAPPTVIAEGRASDVLARVGAGVRRGEVAGFGSERDGWIVFDAA
jgi:3-oxoacyl-(acyl-carrier-protein) synthase